MLQEKIRTLCLEDAELLAKIAVACGKKTITAYRMVERNQSKELASVYVIKAISKYTGLTEKQILEPKTAMV